MKHYFWLLSLFVILFTGCSNVQEEIIDPDEGETKGKVTFTFPLSRGVSTYSVAASTDEKTISLAELTIYMVNAADIIERIFDSNSISPASASIGLGATITIPGDATGIKRFYFVANNALVSDTLNKIVVGDKLSKLLSLNTYDQTNHLQALPGVGLLLCGSVSMDVTSIAATNQNVTLKRRVARFDVSNDSVASLTSIKEILIYKASQSTLIFPENLGVEYLKDVKKTDLQALPFTTATYANPNDGDTPSVFYLYPSDSVIIQIRAAFNGTERLYDIPLPAGGIEANKCYKIKTKSVESHRFELEVVDWTETEIVSAHDSEIKISGVVGVEPAAAQASWTTTPADLTTTPVTPATYTYNAKTMDAVLTVKVLSQSSLGVYTEVSGLPTGYNITVAKKDNPTLISNSTSYQQTLEITIPHYTLGALNAIIHIRPAMDSTKSIDINVVSI